MLPISRPHSPPTKSIEDVDFKDIKNNFLSQKIKLSCHFLKNNINALSFLKNHF